MGEWDWFDERAFMAWERLAGPLPARLDAKIERLTDYAEAHLDATPDVLDRAVVDLVRVLCRRHFARNLGELSHRVATGADYESVRAALDLVAADLNAIPPRLLTRARFVGAP